LNVAMISSDILCVSSWNEAHTHTL